MITNKNLYDEESIQSLSPLEFTRLRPQVYCGSTEYSTQLLLEILSNAIDEHKAGHGNIIDINITGSKVSVRDNGQGFIPMSFRDDGKTILEASFSVLNTSGKFSEDGVYEGVSLGLYGIGAKLPIFLSTDSMVETHRDGQFERVYFKDGVMLKRENGKSKSPTGTLVEWTPDKQFFDNVEVNISELKSYLSTIVCLCQGLTIKLNNNGENTTYFAKNGLTDYVDEKVSNKEIIKNRFIVDYINGKNAINLILTYTTNYSSTIVPYVNTGLTESGPHITQLKTIFTKTFNQFLREKKFLKDKDENLTGDDIQEGMYLVFNITTTGVGYDAQVKTRVSKLDMRPFIPTIIEQLNLWFNQNEKDMKAIADKAINARKAREAAKKAKEAIRQPKEKGLKAKLALSKKFTDCISKNPKERNLLLVEGNSAAASAIEARNTKTDCIYMLRGKIVSPLKTDISKILQNQEMSDIIKVIGAGFGQNFDVNKMNFNKIVITSDQDSDGMDIELLLITFFYTYMRPLVEAGKLYRAVTPLYIIRQKGKEFYCYSEEELDEWKKTHKGSYDLLRAKGLGELNAEDLQKVCFLNERYKRITISDIEQSTALLNVLQGPSVEPRKKFIYENATELGFNFD